jgi:WD40 repeat protein
METGKTLSLYSPRRAVSGSTREFSFNAAGTRLAICERRSSDLAIVDVESGRELIYLPHTSSVVAVGFHPDGNRLYTATRDGTVLMWDGTPGTDDLEINLPGPEPRANPGRAFIDRFDADGDGMMSPEEFPAIWERFPEADTDNDGNLDTEELRRVLRSRSSSGE